MGKLCYDGKLRIQTIREQGLGAKAIVSSYPDKGWKLITVKNVCSPVDYTGSAVLRQPGSGRPAAAITNQNVERVDELICSKEGNNGAHLSTRQIAADLNISQSSVSRIAKRNLHVKSIRSSHTCTGH